jgi:hypothetical protein
LGFGVLGFGFCVLVLGTGHRTLFLAL